MNRSQLIISNRCLRLLPLFLGFSALAADTNESKLPAPAPVQIDFARDIKPILEHSCFRCHGPEKPRSNFRLYERAAALKGGENGVDIFPGNSAKSPMVAYVSELVEDMEMPPTEKRDKYPALTKEQIGLVRAWIDQGAK